MAERTPPTPPPNGTAAVVLAPVNDLDIIDELQSSYRTYALSVIVSRALPDVRDGLKPSHRRILVAMNDLGLGPTSATSKCAGIIGETMKRYHPHGDASIYDSLVRMAQDWNLRYRLVHGQGNFGSIAGLPPAAHRYTEARLTPVAAELLDDLERETVDFIDNYDGKYREPLVLPARFPNLLVNGSDGIAVGIATHIPPHNLREVCKALVRMIDNPDVTLLELLEDIPGPDFPTGGVIMGRQGVIDAYRDGYGRVTLRARADVVEGKNPQVVIREVPFQVSRIPLCEEIGQLVKDERIANVRAIRDESSAKKGEPVKIVVELTNKGDPHMVLNQLYQYTKLQKTVSINMWALTDGEARRLPLRELLRKFLDHRAQVIRRRTEYLLREAKRRGHVLEGQLIALADIETVIRVCRESPNRAEAKRKLQETRVPAALLERAIGAEAFAALQRELGSVAEYQMTEAQAEAIVRLQLGQLANLESGEILKEYQGLREQIRGYETLLSDEANVRAVIRADLEEMAARYGDDRKTAFSDDAGDVDLEDLIEDEPNVVTITHQQFIKRMPLTEYRVQGRGGKGVQGGLRDDDFVEHFFVASTKAYLLCFTNTGQLYWLKVHRIPTAARTSAGRSIANVLQSLKPDEKITSIVPVREFADGFHLTMATRKGTVKKTDLMAYSNVRQGGIIGITLDDGDELIDVCLTKPGDEVVLSTRKGMAIRFSEADARSMGRTARGVKGIKLGKDDEVVGMVVADPDGLLLTVTENGYGKRTPFGANSELASPGREPGEAEDEVSPDPEPADGGESDADEPADENDPSGMRYRIQRRGGKGLKDVKVTAKNGPVVGITSVRGGDEIMLITAQGMVTRSKVDDIRRVGRNTQGVRVMNLNEGDKLVTVAKVARETEAAAADAPEPVARPGWLTREWPMRVLITGGYGFIGAWIARELLARGDAVFAYDLKEDPRRLRLILPDADVKKVAFVRGDVTDLGGLSRAIGDHGVTHVIHLAGLQVPTCRADPMLGARVNVLGTLAVFEAAKASGGQVRRVVYASSAAVFGGPDKYPATGYEWPLADDVPLVPSTHYGVFKCCNEGNARIYFQDSGITSVGLRPWTVYGVGRDLGMTSEPTKAIKAVLVGRPYHISFGGWTDFQYVEDVAKTFVLCLERPYTGAKSYNMRGQVVTLADFHKALCAVLPEAAKLVTLGTTQIAIAHDLSDAALSDDLGPMPKTSLEDGIRETVRIFSRLRDEGRLDTADLDAPKPAPVTVADEP